MNVLRETDNEAIRLARTLLRISRYGSLAVIDPKSGAPLASRVAVASDHDGAPLILVSALAAHTGALLADPRCSLLLGHPGKGDPLAHARISIACNAQRIVKDDARHERVSWRFLSHNPKSNLYAGLGDFSFFRLDPVSASLNGGFGKAFALSTHDLLTKVAEIDEIAAVERGAVSHMNEDHADAIDNYAAYFGKRDQTSGWVMTGIDADGFTLRRGDDVLRIQFREPLPNARDIHARFVAMAIEARQNAQGRE